jgi:hypothetical protein
MAPEHKVFSDEVCSARACCAHFNFLARQGAPGRGKYNEIENLKRTPDRDAMAGLQAGFEPCLSFGCRLFSPS